MAIAMENGAAEDEHGLLTTIQLEKGSGGLGFNVVGGSDQPHIPGDHGIFVSRIRKDGPAYQDGRLKEGDRVMSVNGRALEEVEHGEAVKVLRAAPPGTVALLVEVDAQRTALEKPFAGFTPSASNESVATVIDKSRAGLATPDSDLSSPPDSELRSLVGSLAAAGRTTLVETVSPLPSDHTVHAANQKSPALPSSNASTRSGGGETEGESESVLVGGRGEEGGGPSGRVWEAGVFLVGLAAIAGLSYVAYRRMAR